MMQMTAWPIIEYEPEYLFKKDLFYSKQFYSKNFMQTKESEYHSNFFAMEPYMLCPRVKSKYSESVANLSAMIMRHDLSDLYSEFESAMLTGLFSLYLEILETLLQEASPETDCPCFVELLIATLLFADDVALFPYSS